MGFFYFCIMDLCHGNCENCLAVNFSLFKGLNKNELHILNKGRNKQWFKKGEIIYKEGDKLAGLICLNKGKVKLVKKALKGEEFICRLHKPVDYLGFDDLMAQIKFSSTAIALEDASICIIKKENLYQVINNNVSLGVNIIKDLARKSIQDKERILNLTQTQLISRISFAINELINFYGFKPDNKTIAIELKRKEIGAIANIDTSNVIRLLSGLKKEKIIDTNKRKIIVLDKIRLINLIE